VIWLRQQGLGTVAAEFVAIAAAVALAAPFLIGILRLVGALAIALAGQALPAGVPERSILRRRHGAR